MGVAIDVDDVLAGFYPAICARYGREAIQTDIWDPTGHCKFIPQNWDLFKHDGRFWAELPVLNGPEKIDFDFDCYISSFPERMKPFRMMWLRDNGFPYKPLYCTADKVKLAKEIGIDIIIDDKLDTINSFNAEEGMKGLWYRPPYMIQKGQDIEDFSQIKPILNDIRAGHRAIRQRD